MLQQLQICVYALCVVGMQAASTRPGAGAQRQKKFAANWKSKHVIIDAINELIDELENITTSITVQVRLCVHCISVHGVYVCWWVRTGVGGRCRSWEGRDATVWPDVYMLCCCARHPNRPMSPKPKDFCTPLLRTALSLEPGITHLSCAHMHFLLTSNQLMCNVLPPTKQVAWALWCCTGCGAPARQ